MHVKSKYGSNAKLLLTYCDSVYYEVPSKNIYQDILQDIDLFYTTEYAQDHTPATQSNTIQEIGKCLGKMKRMELY